eukprot:331412-Lingulodinium_polyedra.AAC.1
MGGGSGRSTWLHSLPSALHAINTLTRLRVAGGFPATCAPGEVLCLGNHHHHHHHHHQHHHYHQHQHQHQHQH